MTARLLRLALVGLLTLTLGSVISTFAAANTVPDSRAKDQNIPVTLQQLTPPECASMALTALVVGSGIVNGGAGNTLILGSAGTDLIKGQAGNDCIVGGGGSDDLRGQAGDDILVGGPGIDTINGGGGVDTCYGYDGTTSGGGLDVFTGCTTQIP